MSTLAGAGESTAIGTGHPEDRYGRRLEIVGALGVGPCMDVAVAGRWLYAIGNGELRVADISAPASPRLVARLGDLGNTRQIEVRDGIAYITAREDGLFLVDVSTPDRPALLCHYDTIELATGIALSGPLAFVACRTYGVELVDISDPRQARHLSSVRTGEAQSVVARDGILYAGVWGTRELVVCDVRNPRQPLILARTPLDGYGDGVDVRGRYCYVATGHHARGLKQRDNPADPAYGAGHGLEIFDIADPAKPSLVSRLKLPRFYNLGMDMWSVTVAGPYAFVADTFNGVFVAVPTRKAPSWAPATDYGEGKEAEPRGAGWPSRDYLRGGRLRASRWRRRAWRYRTPEPDHAPAIPPEVASADARFDVYKPAGQVYAVAFAADTAWVAAGAAGLHAVQLWPEIRVLATLPTDGFAMDVKVMGETVFVAEGRGGLSIWHRGDGTAVERVGRYAVPGQSIKQVVVPAPGRYALLHVGQNTLHIVDVANPAQPHLAMKDSRLGLLYGYQITDGLIGGRYASCFWHVTGFYWYDLYGAPTPAYTGDNYAQRLSAENGAAVLGDALLVTSAGGYFMLSPEETRPPEALPHFGIAGRRLDGKPSIFGKTLYVSNRFWGRVTRVDISKPEAPRCLDALDLDGNPGRVVEHNGKMIIPAGYLGLLVER